MRRLAFPAFLTACAAGLALLQLAAPTYLLTPLIYIGLSSLVCIGLVMLSGLAGMSSFGQASFCGLGAYATGVLTTSLGWPSLGGLAAGLMATAGVAAFIGAVTARLSGHYLVLGTLAWSIGFYYLFANIEGLGGFNGLTGLSSIDIAGFAIATPRRFFGLVWVCAAIALWASANIIDSRIGRAIRAVPVDVMASSMGVRTAILKVQVFVFAALLAALSGWLQAHYLKIVTPGSFGVNASLDYVFMSVIGGIGQLGGALIGATLVEVLRDLLRDWMPGVVGQAGSYEQTAFGLIVIVLLRNAPAGLSPMLSRILPRPRRATAPSAAQPLTCRSTIHDAVLDVQAVSKRFGGLLAVDRVSLRLRVGEIVGLIGPNGAGKSTLFNLLTGVAVPDSGSIAFGGQRIDGAAPAAIAAAGISRTFQHVLLRPEMTVLENVAIGAHLRGRSGFWRAALRLDRHEERCLLFEAQRQLDRVGLGHLAAEPARNLPLGQQRIVEIARALASDPAILLLDEPAAGLRYAEKQKLGDLLDELRRQGIGILVVEHDMGFILKLADRVAILEFGQKIAEGPPDVVSADERVIEAYLGVDLDAPAFVHTVPSPQSASAPMTPLLNVDDLSVFYDKAVAVEDATLRVEKGQIVSVIGPNGAGKTSLLNAIIGALPSTGDMWFNGAAISRASLEERVHAGLALVPETRALFGSMTVHDNLLLGAFKRRREGAAAIAHALEEVYGIFPRLSERSRQYARTLSGGERQMLALGRALVGRPELLLLDEPSLGLAPRIVWEILRIVVGLRDQGVSILLVEQNARAALNISDYGYVIEQGRIRAQGPSFVLRDDPAIVAAYLGLSAAGTPDMAEKALRKGD